MRKRKLIRFLLPPIGIIGVPVVSLVGLFTYTPDTSTAFPYIPPPPNGYYIEATINSIYLGVYTKYDVPFNVQIYVWQSFIFKNVLVTNERIKTRMIDTYARSGELVSSETETYFMAGLAQFVPQDPSDLKELKAGDVVDIIGVCTGVSKEWQTVVVFRYCQFLPAGVASLPLPGGPLEITGGY